MKMRYPRDVRTKQTVPPAYLRLLEQFRLRPIRNDTDLDEATALIDRLLSRREPLRPEEEDYLEVLSDLVERYEEEHEQIPGVEAREILRFLIEQRGLTQQAVARQTRIANSTISAVLRGQRELTRGHIERLAAYFDVEPGVFLPGNR